MSKNDTDYPKIVHEWLVGEPINEGSFGAVFRCCKKGTGIYAAIKFEKEGVAATQIHYEYQIYKHLKSNFFPQVFDAGTATSQNGTNFKYMIMELVGVDCSYIINESTQYKLEVFMNVLKGIEALHSQGYIHRDIKPKNICLAGKVGKGLGTTSTDIKIVDLGLAKKYISINNKHIPNQIKKSHVGTMRYASLNSTAYTQSSRRDDIESLIYTFVNIYGKKLPWQNTSRTFKDKKKKTRFIHSLKTICSPRRVCKGLPPCFERILINVKYLHFKERPPYQKYYQLIRSDIKKTNYP